MSALSSRVQLFGYVEAQPTLGFGQKRPIRLVRVSSFCLAYLFFGFSTFCRYLPFFFIFLTKQAHISLFFCFLRHRRCWPLFRLLFFFLITVFWLVALLLCFFCKPCF